MCSVFMVGQDSGAETHSWKSVHFTITVHSNGSFSPLVRAQSCIIPGFFFPGRNHSASFPFWQMPKDKTSRRIGHLSELLLVAYLLWYVSLSGMQMDLIMVIITPLYASWWQLRMSCLNVLWRKLEFRSSFWKGRRKKNESSVVCRKCLMFC